MKDREIKLYFSKEDGVDADVFEIEENEHEITRMDIKDFKELAIKTGALKEEETDEKTTEDSGFSLEGHISSSFEVVEQ